MIKSKILTETDKGILIKCRIQPSASKTAFVGIHDHTLKFSLAAPPVDGKANKTLCTFLAKQLKIPKSAVKIISGAKSRLKTVLCANRTKKDILEIFKITDLN
jgi:uncharacterized protein